ncbi:MAG: LysM domain-containing protein [Candidatus Aenigmatarchaeota archaeon]
MSYRKAIAKIILIVAALTGCNGQTQYQRQIYTQQPTAEATKTTPYRTPTTNPPWDGTQQQCNAAGGIYIPDQNRCAITGPGVVLYQVRKGDTLWDIASIYGITDWERFLTEFGLLNPDVNKDELEPGEMILIPYQPNGN